MTSAHFDETIEIYHRALGELLRGDPEPVKGLFSTRTDVTLANPFGPAVRGKTQVDAVIDHAAAGFRDGQIMSFERISGEVRPDLAYIVEVEHLRARLGGGQDISPFSLRATTVLRHEDGEWKIVHRHADPITTARPAESLAQK
jgi:ketosteroid isomerase-like protein